MIQLFKNLKTRRLQRAIKKANNLSDKSGNVFLVLNDRGKPRVAARNNLKRLINAGKFKKGVNIRTFDKIALYSTKQYKLCSSVKKTTR